MFTTSNSKFLRHSNAKYALFGKRNRFALLLLCCSLLLHPAKAQITEKLHLYGSAGAVFFPGNEKLTTEGLAQNIFAAYKPGMLLGAGFYYAYNNNLWIGPSFSFFQAAKPKFGLGYTGGSLRFRYALPSTKFKFYPYLIAEVNYANLLLQRERYTETVAIDSATLAQNPANIIVSDVTYNNGQFAGNISSFGLAAGVGFQYRHTKKVSVFGQMMFGTNLNKNNPLVTEYFNNNKSNLAYYTAEAGLSYYLGKGTKRANINKNRQLASKRTRALMKQQTAKAQKTQKKQAESPVKPYAPPKEFKPAVAKQNTSNPNALPAKSAFNAPANADPKKDAPIFNLSKINREGLDPNKRFTIAGQLDQAALRNAGDVELILTDDGGKEVAKIKPDANGSYSYKHLKPGNYNVDIKGGPEGITSKSRTIIEDPDLKLDKETFGAFAYKRLGGSFVPDNTVVGKAMLSDGSRAGADQTVLLFDKNGNEVGRAKTDKEGNFIFKNLRPDEYQAMLENNPAGVKANLRVSGYDPDMKLSADNFNFKKLSAKSGDNIVVGSVQLGDKVKNPEDVSILLVNDKGEIVTRTNLDKNGNFSFKNLKSDNYTAVVDGPNPNLKANMRAYSADADLKVGSADFAKYNYATLSGEKPNNLVVGQVNVNGSYRSPKDVSVLLINDAGEIVGRANTDAQGTFAFSQLPPDNYQTVIEDNDPALSAKVTAAVGDPNMKMSAEDFKKYYYEKLGRSGKSDNVVVGNVQLTPAMMASNDVGILLLDDAGKVIARTKTDKNGNFAFKQLNPANYQAVLEKPVPGVKAQMMPADNDPRLALSSEDFRKYNFRALDRNGKPDYIAVGKVLNAEGKNVEDVTVLLLDDAGNVVATTKADKKGSFAFRKLEASNYQAVIANPELNLKAAMKPAGNDPAMQLSPESFRNYNYQKLNSSNPANNLVVGKVSMLDSRRSAADVGILLLDESGAIVERSTTDKNGNFIFKKLNPDKNYQAVLENPNPNMRAKLAVATDDPDMKIGLEELKKYNYDKLSSTRPSHIVTGAIVSGSRRTIEDNTVLLLNDKDEIVAKAVANEKGQFAFRDLPLANYRAVPENPEKGIKAQLRTPVNDPDLSFNSSEVEHFNPETGARETLGPNTKIRIEGALPGLAGTPGEESVWLIDDEGNVIQTVKPDAQGRFTFENVKAEKYKVTYENKGAVITPKIQVYEDRTEYFDDPNIKTKRKKVAELPYKGKDVNYQKDALDKVVNYYRSHPNVKMVYLNVYADAGSSDKEAYELGLKRAKAVQSYLEFKGVPAYKIRVNNSGKPLQFKSKYSVNDPALNNKIDISMDEQE